MADDPTTTTTTTTPTESTAQSARRETLIAELAAERLEGRKLSDKLAGMENELGKVRTETEERVKVEVGKETAKATKLRDRLMTAELRTMAAEMGLADPDLLQHPLLDRNAIKIDEEGNVSGVKEAFELLKQKKPDWFKKPGDQQQQQQQRAPTGGPTPTPTETPTTDVKKMNQAEYAAWKQSQLAKFKLAG